MRLQDFLDSSGMTQTELARRLGVTPGLVWQWLNGRRPIAATKVIPLEVATDGRVSRHDLRPDIYPVESKRRASMQIAS